MENKLGLYLFWYQIKFGNKLAIFTSIIKRKKKSYLSLGNAFRASSHSRRYLDNRQLRTRVK